MGLRMDLSWHRSVVRRARIELKTVRRTVRHQGCDDNMVFCGIIWFLLCLILMTTGCEVNQTIPQFTKQNGGMSVPGAASTFSWSSATAIDNATMGVVNVFNKTNWSCKDQYAGFRDASGAAASGCVQQTPIAYSNGHWFVGFPQWQSAFAMPLGAATATYAGALASLSSAVTSLFGGFGTGLGFMSPTGGTYATQGYAAKYISYAKLTSGKVVSLFWLGRTDADNGSQIWSNVYNPSTDSWGTATCLRGPAAPCLSTYGAGEGPADDIDVQRTRDIAWDAYANTSSGAGNYCRPRIAASGNAAMATWCEYRTLNATSVSDIRHSLYVDGTGWVTNTAASYVAPLHSIADSGGQKIPDSTLVARYHPGVAQRLTVPAPTPNALFLTEATNSRLWIWNAIPASNQTASCYIDLTALATPVGVGVSTHAFSDGTRLFLVAGAAVNRLYFWQLSDITMPGVVGNACTVAAGPTILGATTALGTPSAIFSDGTKLMLSDLTGQQVFIWNYIPVADTAGSPATPSVTITGFTGGPRGLFTDGTKLYVADPAAQLVYVWDSVPAVTTTIASASRTISFAGVAGTPYSVYSNGRRLMVVDNANANVRIWKTAPTASVAASTSSFTLTTGANPTYLASDGGRLFVANAGANTVSIWSKIPENNVAADYTLTNASFGAATPLSLAWSKMLPSGWPVPSGNYSVNPQNSAATFRDTLTITFRGQTVTLTGFPGDPVGFNRCVAIESVVNFINASPALQQLNVHASLPQEWGEPVCGWSTRGEGQYFYLTHNHNFLATDGVDMNDTADGLAVAITPTAAANLPLRFFYLQNTADGAATSTLNRTNSSLQYFVGRVADDSNATTTNPQLNGVPVLPAGADASNVEANNISTDISAASFLDVAGTGSGNFALVQGSRSVAQTFERLMLSSTSQTLGQQMKPYESAFPRVLFGYLYRNWDWLRRYSGANALPTADFIGPTEPYAVSYINHKVQHFPLSMRWPRVLSSANGKGIVLFYSRDGQNPYLSKDTSTYDGYGTSSLPHVNHLWMATFDDREGYGQASIISPVVKESSASLASDQNVCETADPFAGRWPLDTSLGTCSTPATCTPCLVGDEAYYNTFNGASALTDSMGYSYDVSPIPAAMNESGQAAIGFHRPDTNTSTNKRIRFYVAMYGSERGLASFTSIDDGTGYTMGGALAIDSSGNVAAVWEQRSLVSRSGTTQAENHIYFRYYNRISGTWGSITQMDSSSISNYGNTDFTYAPRAPMMPNVAFGDGGKILVTWSGPSGNTAASSQRRMMVNQFYAH